ncbi:BTB and MATH domain-containing protein 43-like [Ixodes scapularis]|uniref:BTB and MATH domain-containing protein 43-like n=1 Tax=Ixodes scapularis TaxID=6945 RepID=UPI001C387D5D|nr:BTB and MATH domain-containing protein 43-like [Ixodes scapularis]
MYSISIDGITVMDDIHMFDHALAVLFSAYYVFNIAYTEEICITLEFIQSPKPIPSWTGILDSASFGDVEIRVGQRSLRAHSDLLGRLSPVFAAMLSGETREATGRVIVIEDLSYEAVRQLVEYLYAGTLSGLVHGAADLYAAADKYGVSQVKQACARQLSNALTPDNALRVFELAVRHSDRDLSRDSARFIDAHLPEVQASDAWETLLKDDSLTLALFKCAARYQTTRADASSASSSSTNV